MRKLPFLSVARAGASQRDRVTMRNAPGVLCCTLALAYHMPCHGPITFAREA